MAAKQEVIPCKTLAPECKDGAELAREIGRIVSKAVGTDLYVYAMKLSMGNSEGDDVTINWKSGER